MLCFVCFICCRSNVDEYCVLFVCLMGLGICLFSNILFVNFNFKFCVCVCVCVCVCSCPIAVASLAVRTLVGLNFHVSV